MSRTLSCASLSHPWLIPPLHNQVDGGQDGTCLPLLVLLLLVSYFGTRASIFSGIVQIAGMMTV
jgi:hypothetical protein